VAVDFFVVPTATFGVLFGFLVLAHDRRRVVHFNVTAHHLPLRAANRADELFGKHRRRRLHLAAFLGPTGWPAIVPTELVCWILAGRKSPLVNQRKRSRFLVQEYQRFARWRNPSCEPMAFGFRARGANFT
jgi:hypothetical protein